MDEICSSETSERARTIQYRSAKEDRHFTFLTTSYTLVYTQVTLELESTANERWCNLLISEHNAL
jgi:hypothetical protein